MAELEKCPEHYIFGLDIGTRSIVGTVGYRENEKKFVIVAQVVQMHETRSMLDGQIHDIGKVAESIQRVRNRLEEMIGFRLEDVCIAAAGRVLKTVTVHVDFDFEEEVVIDAEHLRTLELLGVEKAYQSLKNEKKDKGIRLYCVGSTIVHYYLNDYLMLSLEGHKGSKISAELIATFLPDEVIDSLYSAVERANLKVANLTLEPIAASEVAIPENYRLLNIAMVDVGAGTSDICITKNGSVIGYGMIPYAGDKFTEVIANQYLVDFATAEEIKMACFDEDEVTYKDIMGLENTVASSEVLECLSDKVKSITKSIAEKIVELNGGTPVSAVFIVGGGGKLPNFAESLAENLDIPKQRVAVRGVEVLGGVEFLQDNIKKDSTLVTPVGICLSYYEKNNNFIMVSINGNQIKLYDNSKLTVMDAAMQIGFPKENIFPKRGKELIYWLNGEKRMLRGETGEASKIFVNGKVCNFNTTISEGDIIEITPSTAGKEASSEIGALKEFRRKDTLSFTVNKKTIKCPRMVKVNDNVVLDTYLLQEDDRIDILDYYSMKELLDFMDMEEPEEFYINHKPGDWEDRIYDESVVECTWSENSKIDINEMIKENDAQEEEKLKERRKKSSKLLNESEEIEKKASKVPEELEEAKGKISKTAGDTEKSKRKASKLITKIEELSESSNEEKMIDFSKIENNEKISSKSDKNSKTEKKQAVKKQNQAQNINVTVNGQDVTLTGKDSYILVDILDVYPFDRTVAGGTSIVIRVNGIDANFSSPISDGDGIELYWES